MARNAAKEERETIRQRKKGEEREKAIPYIEDSECVATPIHSAGRLDFTVEATRVNKVKDVFRLSVGQ